MVGERLLFWLAVGLLGSVGRGASDFSSQMSAVVELTDANYAETEGKIGWIISFGEGPAPDELAAVAESVEGLARVGHVDTVAQTELLTILELDGFESPPAARGKLIGDGKPMINYDSVEAAKNAVLAELPANAAKVFADASQFQPFLAETLQMGQLPVLLLSDKQEVPKLFVKLDLWMGELFRFGVFANPADEVLKQFGAKKTPFLTMMIPQPVDEKDGADGAQFQFAPAPYRRKQFGGMKFKNVVKFLATVQQELTQAGYFEKFQHFKVPGKKERASRDEPAGEAGNGAGSAPRGGSMAKTEPLFEYTADTPDACGAGKLGLCIIGLLDGSPPNAELEEQKAVLADAQSLPGNKGRPLHFMWVDLACHPSFGEAFGLDLSNVPTAIAVSPKKAAMASFFGGFNSKNLNKFIHGVLGGKNRIAPLPAALDKKVPPIPADDDCAAVHAAMTPPAEEEDMDDIMAEMLAEEEERRKAEAAAAEEEEPELDAELEAKHAKARAEMEKLNKMSSKSKKKKKKKKKKKGKKAKKSKADL